MKLTRRELNACLVAISAYPGETNDPAEDGVDMSEIDSVHEKLLRELERTAPKRRKRMTEKRARR